MADRRIAGLTPWLPWPLSRWRLWTEPVRAERLAALRIGIALVLLADILTTYGPHVNDFYGPDSLTRIGDRDVFASHIRGETRPPAWYWSLWRGLGHPVNFGFFLGGWVFLSGWITCRLADRLRPGDAPPFVSWSYLVGGWIVFTILMLL